MMNKILNMKGQRGVAAIEFAIVLPVLVVLLFGIIEFSVLLYDKAVITNASREGARAGIVHFDNPDGTDHPSDSDILSAVNQYCQNYLITFGDASTTEIITITRTGDLSGDPLTVNVAYQYDFLVLPNFVSDLAGGINLAGVTVMRME